MREYLVNFFSDPQETTGLLVEEAMTGYGKTRNAVEGIYEYIHSSACRGPVMFVTTLIKNLPEEEFHRVYADADNTKAYEKEVLVLRSNFDSVAEAIFDVQVPQEFQTERYLVMLDQYRQWKGFKDREGLAITELKKRITDELKEQVEPAFRHELEEKLHKDFPTGPAQRREAIRTNKKYQWIAKFYPAVFTDEYKILMLTVSKLIYKNSTLVEPSYDFLSERMLRDKVVCIDEFDASKETILAAIIELALHLGEDYLRLFRQIYSALQIRQFPIDLTNARNQYEQRPGNAITYEQLKIEANRIFDNFSLRFSIKTAEGDVDKGKNFLFHDGSYHTVLNGNRSYIRATLDNIRSQVIVHFEDQATYRKNRSTGQQISVQNMLRQIYVFLRKFQNFVRGWGDCYSEIVNARRENTQDACTNADAIWTIYREYGLSEEQIKLLIGELSNTVKGNKSHNSLLPDLSIYENGFRLFEFVDSDSHLSQTQLRYIQVQNTPEKVMLYLCRHARVVGMSATAALPTVTGNYDLKYLRQQLGQTYHVLPRAICDKIGDELQLRWQPYYDGRIKVDLTVVDKDMTNMAIRDRLEKILPESLVRKYENLLGFYCGSDTYIQNRYCNLLAAMRSFWEHSDIKSFLCLNQALPKKDSPGMNLDFLNNALKDIGQELTPSTVGSLFVMRSGDGFEQEKELLLERLSAGEKIFILSTYKTIGAGQNLQYSISDTEGLVRLCDNDSAQDARLRKKDMDALYLGDITHVAVNLHGDKLSSEDLLRFCFQVECLYQNDELSYEMLHRLLKLGIKHVNSKDACDTSAERKLTRSTSIRCQATRDIMQAIGRIGRTFLKKPTIYLYTTQKVLSDLEPECLEQRLLCPEMQVLTDARKAIALQSMAENYALNEAERVATRGNAYILRMLTHDWTIDSMKLWKGLRDVVLRYPRTGNETRCNEPVINQYYIRLQKEQTVYYYAQKGDFSEVILDLQGNKEAFNVSSRCEELTPSEVSEIEARLPEILAYPGMVDYFRKNGWATEFGRESYILSPVLFQNIYKGALGEVAGRFILEHELGLKLKEIEDPEKFECFDFELSEGVYLDFKHWKAGMTVDDQAMRKKIRQKLDRIGGNRVYIVNLLESGSFQPAISKDKCLIEIPCLLNKNGRVNEKALKLLGGKI